MDRTTVLLTSSRIGIPRPTHPRPSLDPPASTRTGDRARRCRRSKLRIWCCALLSAASLSIAAAQRSGEGSGSLGLGPQIGIYKPGDADGARVMGGVALRMKFGGGLGIEGSVNYKREEYQNGSVAVRSWPVMVTGLLYPLPVLYGAVGAGWYNTEFEYRFPSLNLSNETKQEFGWHFGAGVEVPAGGMGTIYGDVRYVFLNYDFQKFPGSDGVNSDFYIISVGFLFGLQ